MNRQESLFTNKGYALMETNQPDANRSPSDTNAPNSSKPKPSKSKRVHFERTGGVVPQKIERTVTVVKDPTTAQQMGVEDKLEAGMLPM